MAAPGKPSLGWGSFLSQAVAGVESRLDNMLAEGAAEGPAQQQQEAASAAKPAQTPAAGSASSSRRASPGPVARSSSNRVNDRLQARLAKAMAGKAPGSSTSSPRGSVDQGSRASTDQRPSMEQIQNERPDEPAAVEKAAATSNGVADAKLADPAPEAPRISSSDDKRPEEPVTNDAVTEEPPSQQTESDNEHTQAATSEPTQGEQPLSSAKADGAPPTEKGTTAGDMTQLTRDVEEIKLRQNEEMQEYVERIDSLQAKLQYLSQSAAEAAKKSASAAPSGSMERRLAEKDQKIALLMEEGQKLSNTEHKFRTTIRKLRAQLAETEKQTEELRESRDRATADMEAFKARLDGSEEKAKRQDEARKATAALQREIDSLKAELLKRDDAARRQEEERRKKREQSETAHAQALAKAVAAEQAKQRELEDSLANLQAEKNAAKDKARQESTEWQEKLNRAVERGRAVEAELRLELTAAEGKLEAMRVAAEEATSGSGGEAQVKLLRQIETLQSQYASASDNWQGIETSLLAKVSNLEKERDEAQRRESEMRKKARDATTRGRRVEDDLQDVQTAHSTAQQELETCREELAALKSASKAAEMALGEARAELEKRQRSTSRDDAAETSRRQWVDDVAGATLRNQSRPESPLMSMPRTFSSDMLGFPSAASRTRRVPTPGSIPDAAGGDGHGYGTSPNTLAMGLGLGPGTNARRFPSRTNASASLAGSMPPPSPFLPPPDLPSDMSHAPSPPIPDRDDPAQDMFSVSTVAAGPSVQLVERMSAAIRRLEAEKVAAKEEMARVCSQRDEARSDLLGLIKDVDAGKGAAARVGELELEVADLNGRYQTTLEMLGEKSELVEELKSDVQDVKAMYRELVERTVR